jgi:hypothetical protein
MSDFHYYVYLLTNNLERKVYEQKMNLVIGFTEKYKVSNLSYFGETRDKGRLVLSTITTIFDAIRCRRRSVFHPCNVPQTL